MEAGSAAAGPDGDAGGIHAHDFFAKSKVLGEEEVGQFFEVNGWLHRFFGCVSSCPRALFDLCISQVSLCGTRVRCCISHLSDVGSVVVQEGRIQQPNVCPCITDLE